MRLLWATRGRTWGFRLVETAGLEQPLTFYTEAFRGLEGRPDAFREREEYVALRLIDPEGRADRAGRPIPHDFVLLREGVDDPSTPADWKSLAWRSVSDEYATIWDLPSFPTATES